VTLAERSRIIRSGFYDVKSRMYRRRNRATPTCEFVSSPQHSGDITVHFRAFAERNWCRSKFRSG
jgi:hypothetical protein